MQEIDMKTDFTRINFRSDQIKAALSHPRAYLLFTTIAASTSGTPPYRRHRRRRLRRADCEITQYFKVTEI